MGNLPEDFTEAAQNHEECGFAESIQKNDELIGTTQTVVSLKKLRRRSAIKGFLFGILGTLAALSLIAFILMKVGYLGIERNTKPENGGGSESQRIISDSLDEKIKNIVGILEENSIYEVKREDLTDGILHGLVKGLDDRYAAYYNAKELEAVRQSNAGIYYGIGVTVQQDSETGLVTVIEVGDDSPAKEAGVQEEDILYKVDNDEATGMDINELVSRIKGEEGTIVNVTFYRPSTNEYLTMDIERRNIKQIISYGSMLEDNIGYIRIKSFDNVTYEQLKETIERLKSEGMKAVVLDLRNNTGGLLTSLVPVADEFLPAGVILTIEDKKGVIETYRSQVLPYLNLPMVVLVNQYTASAAEALTGAIQDHGVGTIVGTTTFGKGIVQNTYSLDDGTAVKLTIAKYMTPNGRCIQDEGIEPDVVVEPDYSGEDNQLAKALEILKEKMN
ncbi:MAG: S41 family peptidase [Lachnospiraceae bacterium]|nr:S41 family peptidase [Lachnospiraceae bacterium]